MKGKVLLGVLGLLVAFRGEAETKPQLTKQEKEEEWLLKNHTPEEMEVWRKIESVRHPGSEVVLWEPLTAAEIQKRERESRQLREAAIDARMYLFAMEQIRTFDRIHNMLEDFSTKIKESSAREAEEAAARREADRKTAQEKSAREAEEAAARHEADKKRWQENSERDALRRERELDAWYLGFKETNPHFYESIVKYRKANGKPLPGYLVNAGKGSESAQLTIVYQVPLTLSLNVVGSRDVDFSEVWKDAIPRKTLTLRGETNAPGRTTLYGYFAGDVAGLSNGTVVIPCAAVTEQANVPLTLTPQEIGTVEKDAVDIPLSLTLEKKEGLVPGRYTGTIVFELVGP